MMVKVETNERRIGRKPVSRHRKVLIGPTNTDIYIYIHIYIYTFTKKLWINT